MVFDRLIKSIVTDISKENSIKFFWRKQLQTLKNDLRPEDLSTKGLERFHGK